MSQFLWASWPQTQQLCHFMLHISVVQLMDVSVDESNWSLQRITVNMLLEKKRYSLNECRALWRPASMQHISTTKASLWCSWCPVPQTEINQIAVLFILTNSHEKLLCSGDDLCCFYWKKMVQSFCLSATVVRW